MKYRGLVFTVGLVLAALPVGSAWAVNNTTNTINGVTTNGGATFTFPSSGLSNFLFISGAGVLTNGTGILGNAAGDGYNQVVVSDSGSVWSNTATLWVGLNGSFNQLTVSNLAAVYAADINIANNGVGDQLTVSSTGQVNSTTMIVGRFVSHGNILMVTNGGLVNVSSTLYIGAENAAATNNLMTVTGPGSRVTAGSLRIGSTGSSNQMVIAQGGVVVNGLGGIGPNGAFNNTVLVTDSGSVWSNTSTLTIGANGAFGNILTVASSGTVYAASIEIAPNATTYGNKLIITNGGRVFNSGGLLLNNAVGTTASNNWIIVTGAGSILTNSGGLTMGRTSPDNHMEIRQGGVVINAAGSIGANDVGASNNVVLVTDSGSVWSNTSSLTIGGNGGANNSLTIATSGTVYATSVTVGSALNAYGNQMILTNGGRYIGGGITLGTSGATGTSNSLLKVTGTGSQVTSSGPITVGGGSFNNQMTVEEGGYVQSSGISRIGVQAAASNNQVVVTGTGSVWSNISSVVVGSGGSGNRLIITNNGTVFATDVSTGESTGSGNSILVHDGGHLNVGGGLTLAPNSTPGASNNLLSIKGAGSTVTSVGLSVGAGAVGNQLIIEQGGTLFSGGGVVRIGNQTQASNNLVVVTGNGSLWTNGSSIVAGNLGNNNRLVVTDGAAVFAPYFTAGEGAGTGNSILVSDRGLVDTTLLSAGVGNSISNVGGIYQFTTATPGITAGRVFITNGTVSFRGISDAPVTPLANLTYDGENSFRLNGASNNPAVAQSYTFNTGSGPTNYVRLELVNGTTLWRNQRLTIGANGSMLASNTLGTVAAAVTNLGAITVVNSHVTWASNVVVSGGYVSDPSTNTFLADATITPSGTLAGGVGDLFDFKKSLFIQSTNSQGFKLHTSSVQFSGGGMHTNEITGLDLGAAVGAYDAAFSLGTNFAYGELHLGSAVDEICFTCANTQPSNALYVGWLDLLTNVSLVANLHASNNVTIYYAFDDPRNAYLGNQTFQLTQCDGVTLGGFLAPVIPEPSALGLLALAAMALLRKNRR